MKQVVEIDFAYYFVHVVVQTYSNIFTIFSEIQIN